MNPSNMTFADTTSARGRDMAYSTTVTGTTKLPRRMIVGIRMVSFVSSVMSRATPHMAVPATSATSQLRLRR
jgi:hypothetical protein